MKKLDEFTDDEIKTASLVLQAIDIEAELFFNSQHAEKFRKVLKLSESDISDLAIDFNETTAPNILLMDSCGYRILLSTFVNVLIAMDKKDMAEMIMSFREDELDELTFRPEEL